MLVTLPTVSVSTRTNVTYHLFAVKRAELAQLTELSEAHLSRIASSIPGAFLNGKQYEFDAAVPEFHLWLLREQLRSAARSLRREMLIARNRQDRRSTLEITKAMNDFTATLEICEPFLHKVRASWQGCQLRAPLTREETQSLLRFLITAQEGPSVEEIVAVSAQLQHDRARKIFCEFVNSLMRYRLIAGGDPLGTVEAAVMPGFASNASTTVLVSPLPDAEGFASWRPGTALVWDGESPIAKARELIQSLWAIKKEWLTVFADLCSWARSQFGDHFVDTFFFESQLLLSTSKQVEAIARVSWHARHPDLSSEHYEVVGRTVYKHAGQARWLRIARDRDLTPVELERSIEKGKIERREDTQAGKGTGSGIVTVYAVRMVFMQWARTNLDPLLNSRLDDQEEVLFELDPIVRLVDQIRANIAATRRDEHAAVMPRRRRPPAQP
jgi:hypothetical protein